MFETVEKNSIEIWKYQMYFLVMEYENKTFLVPPVSIFQHIFLVVRWIAQKTCIRHKKESKSCFFSDLLRAILGKNVTGVGTKLFFRDTT